MLPITPPPVDRPTGMAYAESMTSTALAARVRARQPRIDATADAPRKQQVCLLHTAFGRPTNHICFH